VSRAVRIVLALLALVIAGAVMGAIAGVVVAQVLGAVNGSLDLLLDALVWRVAAAIGAVCGAVLAPLASFTILRHAPLWRVFADTTVGTVLGGCLGLLINPGGDLRIVVSLAALGFLLAAGRLAWSARRARSARPTSDAEMSRTP
jgi:hypothetical protein